MARSNNWSVACWRRSHDAAIRARPLGLGLCLKAKALVLLAEFRHRHDIAEPEVAVLAPVDGLGDLLLGAPVKIEHQPGCVTPALRDSRALAAVALDAVSEMGAEPFDVFADWRAPRLAGRPRRKGERGEGKGDPRHYYRYLLPFPHGRAGFP